MSDSKNKPGDEPGFFLVQGSLVRWFAGSLVRWFAGSLVRWFAGFGFAGFGFAGSMCSL
jgi:hypothetical protein